MKVIYLPIRGDVSGGGPSVFCYKFAQALSKIGHKVIYNNPAKADVCIAIIETGKIFRQIDRKKTRVILRIDGIYNKMYDEIFGLNREANRTPLHEKLKQDLTLVDWVVYQSNWSKSCIDEEIVKRDTNFSIIHNAVDINLFKPLPREKSNSINLFHIGKMRNGYIMESLIGTYQELKKRGYDTRLILAGNMDAECSAVYKGFIYDDNIKYIGPFPNNKLANVFNQGDIYLGPRQGSSSDNVIAEAQACGLPVVIPSFGGNVDMVKDGESGVIVSAKDWDYGQEYNLRLADAVEKIIPDLNGFKTRARRHAERNLGINSMINEYIRAMNI